MKKRILKIFLLFLITLLVIVVLYLNYIGPAVSGYAAKGIASGIFLSGRTQQSLENEDINFSFMKYCKTKVDFQEKKVTSRFLLWKSEAVYNEGLGCTLVRDFTEKEVEALDYPEIEYTVISQDTLPWPAGNLVKDTIPTGIDMEKINAVVGQAFSDSLPWKGTFGLMVVYKDQIVAERYRSDFNASTHFLSWSMAKSITNALVGILVKEGKTDIHKPILRKEWMNDDRRNITLNHLLHMNSGLKFNEEYSTLKLTDVTTMLLKEGDMADYAASQKLLSLPDSVWVYSGGSTNIVCEEIRNIIGNEADYLAFPRKALFSKTGMHSAVFEPDASGIFVGSSYLYATLRDYARFGLLFLHNGNWLGEQILTEDWIDYTTTAAKGSKGDYGASFWLNHAERYPGTPTDMYSCEGHDGQFIFIIPSKQLVVVRSGYSPGSKFKEEMIRRIANAVE